MAVAEYVDGTGKNFIIIIMKIDNHCSPSLALTPTLSRCISMFVYQEDGTKQSSNTTTTATLYFFTFLFLKRYSCIDFFFQRGETTNASLVN